MEGWSFRSNDPTQVGLTKMRPKKKQTRDATLF